MPVRRFDIFRLLLIFTALVVGATSARAATNPQSCANDIDCVATPACGGDVCSYPTQTCRPANPAAGSDGWCNVDTDCKCNSQGATCVDSFCTFTVPQHDGGAATGGAAGPSATGGAAGSSATGGSHAATGGAPGTDGGTKSSSSSSGCAVGGSAPGGSIGFMLAGLIAIAFVRRRRRA